MRCSLALLTATASLAAAVCLAPASAASARGRGGARTAALAMAEGMGRRTALRLAGAAAAAGASAGPEAAHASLDGTEWPLWPALPLAPYGKRKTLRRDVGPGVWAFEQVQQNTGGGGGIACNAVLAGAEQVGVAGDKKMAQKGVG